MTGYTPIFSKIVDSSLWCEPDLVVKVFLTMLAKKDADNVVRGSAFNISQWAKKTELEVLDALKILASPDTRRLEPQLYEGRRIEKVEDGWLLLNGEMYQQLMMKINRRAYKTAHEAARREKEAKPEPPDKPSTPRFQKPTQSELEGAGLSTNEAIKFLNFYESKGWKIGKNLMTSWPHAVGGWKSKSAEFANGSTSQKKPASVFEITKVIEAKTKLADELKHKYASEGAISTEWSPPEKRLEHSKLRGEIKQLTQQIASMA